MRTERRQRPQIIGELLNPRYRPETARMMKERDEQQLIDLMLEQQGNGATMLSLSTESLDDESLSLWRWLWSHYRQHLDMPLYFEDISLRYLDKLLSQMHQAGETEMLPKGTLVRCGVDGKNRKNEKNEKDGKVPEYQRLLSRCAENDITVVLADDRVEDRNRQARLQSLLSLREEALSVGLKREQLVLEIAPLVALQMPLLLQESLATIELVKQESELPVLVQVSKVSRFRRLHGWSNAFFVACAMERGADYFLLNPAQREVMAIIDAGRDMLY